MELQYQHTVEGAEVGQEDLNILGENSALADDRVFAELLRVTPNHLVSGVTKGVLLPGFHEGTGSWNPDSVVGPAIGARSVYVYPFRAVVGPRTEGYTKEWSRGVRSAFFISPTGERQHQIVLPATNANHRWDLIYARVDIDVEQAPVTRYVKGVDNTVSAQSVATTKVTQVSVVVLSGDEGAVPVRPETPTDGGGAYYIPLAYVLSRHPSAEAVVEPYMIHDVAPVMQLSQRVGGSQLAPCNRLHSIGGFVADAWTEAAGRPRTNMPPSMVGSVQRIIALKWDGYGNDLPLGSSTIIDDSIDWRRRLFRTEYYTENATNQFAFTGFGSLPLPNNPTGSQMGQSFSSSTYFDLLPEGSFPVLHLTESWGLAAGAVLIAYVDYAGRLCVQVSATSPGRAVMLWFEATGTFNGFGSEGIGIIDP